MAARYVMGSRFVKAAARGGRFTLKGRALTMRA